MLIKKVEKISQLIQTEGSDLNFMDLAATLRDLIPGSSVYLVSRKGKLLGYALVGDFESTAFDAEWIDEGILPDDLATSLLKVGASSTGTEAEKILGVADSGIFPVVGSGRRVGTLLLVGAEFNEEELVLAEYVATSVGLIISYAIDEEEEDEAEERRMARSAIKSLSYSEILAMQHIFDELDGDEGLLVASRIADQAGITRSVIVNALRKLASANVIESRSLGMKGTYLRILNRHIRDELARQRYPYLTGPAARRK
ncbi:MAG: GTP-sensing pleiotropic transcriptional regulator CodY [Firmicutes bacterium]|nr:GTP-sensing pleiotropic transcriptional regulator CodY [Bacillota bacterium]